jgi:hypothetical protein
LYCGMSSVSTNLSSLLSRILESTGLRIEPYAKQVTMQRDVRETVIFGHFQLNSFA